MKTFELATICEGLNDKALETGFFSERVDILEATADTFVQEWCCDHEVTSHLISPFRWSFDKEDHEIRSGVVEFDPKADPESIGFTWVDLSDSKITQAPNPEMRRPVNQRR